VAKSPSVKLFDAHAARPLSAIFIANPSLAAMAKAANVEAQEFQAWMSSSPADRSVEKQLWNVKKFTSSQVKSGRLATVWLPVVSVYNCKLDKTRLSYFTHTNHPLLSLFRTSLLNRY
jgi:hypothetical protein